MQDTTIIARQTPLGPKPGLLRLRSLTRWAAGIRAHRPRPCPTRRMRRGEARQIAWERALERAQDRIRRRLARRFGPLGPHNLDDFLGALDQAKTAYVLSNNVAVARLWGRRGLAARTAPRPRAPAAPISRATPAAPSEGPSAQGPPDEDEGETSEESDPPPSPARPRRSRSRGRPRKARRFKAHASPRVYRRRIGALNVVAEALEGRADGLFLTLTPLEPPDERARRLAAVPPDVAQAFARFAARLRRAGATYALVIATRADGGAFYPHGHALVAGVGRDKLAEWAGREGLKLHAEPLRNPQAAVRYVVRAGQKSPFDGVLGARGFYSHLPNPASPPKAPADLPGKEAPRGVSSRNTPCAGFTPGEIPRGLQLMPGVRIVDPDRFLAALAKDLEAQIPAVRHAARHRLALLRAALAEGGPP